MRLGYHRLPIMVNAFVVAPVHRRAQLDAPLLKEGAFALKMVARLQAEATAGGPFLLLPLRISGHGGAVTLTALLEQDVDELSFYCWALDVAPPSAEE